MADTWTPERWQRRRALLSKLRTEALDQRRAECARTGHQPSPEILNTSDAVAPRLCAHCLTPFVGPDTEANENNPLGRMGSFVFGSNPHLYTDTPHIVPFGRLEINISGEVRHFAAKPDIAPPSFLNSLNAAYLKPMGPITLTGDWLAPSPARMTCAECRQPFVVSDDQPIPNDHRGVLCDTCAIALLERGSDE